MTNENLPPPPPQYVASSATTTTRPWYFSNGAVIVGFVLGLWPGLILLAVRPPRTKKKTITSISAAVLLLLATSLSGNAAEPTSGSKDSPQTTTSTTIQLQSYKDFLKPGIDFATVVKPVCGKMKSLFASKSSEFDSLNKVGEKNAGDPYGSASLLEKNPWWNEATPLLDDVYSEVGTALAPIVNALLTDTGIKIATSSKGAELNQEIANDAEVSCGIRDLVLATAAKAEALQSLRRGIRVAASQIPWFPKGYSEYETGVAYKWLKYGQYSCTYSTGYCWGMSVVSETGCNSLYVEINILDSAGNNIGYTNDTTSGLRAGQSAKLIFDSFEEAADKAQISKISCY
jgi:hypothetical protein